jgi:DNA-binding MarR family transcriptional regulator
MARVTKTTEGEFESGEDHLDVIVKLWALEWPDLDSSPLAVFGRIEDLNDRFERRIAPIFAEHNLFGGAFEVLSALRRSGSPYQLSPGELSRQVVVTAGAMTKRLDALERDGLVERMSRPGDRRGLLISLTAEGYRIVNLLLPRVITEARAILSPLEPDVEILNDSLRRLLVEEPGDLD